MELEWLETPTRARLTTQGKYFKPIVIAHVHHVVTGWQCLVARDGHQSVHPTKEEAMAMAVAIVRMK